MTRAAYLTAGVVAWAPAVILAAILVYVGIAWALDWWNQRRLARAAAAYERAERARAWAQRAARQVLDRDAVPTPAQSARMQTRIMTEIAKMHRETITEREARLAREAMQRMADEAAREVLEARRLLAPDVEAEAAD